jgi:type IV secretory pathway VirB9-like protein
LPVLYLANNKAMQMVNYRYKQPYFIVDALFSRAWLISGKGREQVRVEIINQNMPG